MVVAAILYATLLFLEYVIVEGKPQSYFAVLLVIFPTGDGSGKGCSVGGYKEMPSLNLPTSNSV